MISAASRTLVTAEADPSATSRLLTGPSDWRNREVDFSYPAEMTAADIANFGDLAHFTNGFDPRFGPTFKRVATQAACRQLSPNNSTTANLSATGPFACYRLLLFDSRGNRLQQVQARVIVRMFDADGAFVEDPAVVQAQILTVPEPMQTSEGVGDGFEQNATADGRLILYRGRGANPHTPQTVYIFNRTPWNANSWRGPFLLEQMHDREAGRRICLDVGGGVESRGCGLFEDFYPLAREPLRQNDGTRIAGGFNCSYPWVTPEGTDIFCSARSRSSALAVGESTKFRVQYFDSGLNVARRYDRSCGRTCPGQSQWLSFGSASGFWAAFREYPAALSGFGRHPENFAMVLFHHYRVGSNWVVQEADFLAPLGGFALYWPMSEYVDVGPDTRDMKLNSAAEEGSLTPDHSMNGLVATLHPGAQLPREYFPEVHRQIEETPADQMRWTSNASLRWWDLTQTGFIGRAIHFRPGGQVTTRVPGASENSDWAFDGMSLSFAVRPVSAALEGVGSARLLAIGESVRLSYVDGGEAGDLRVDIHDETAGWVSYDFAGVFRDDEWTHVGLDLMSAPNRLDLYRNGRLREQRSIEAAPMALNAGAEFSVGPSDLSLDTAADAVFLIDEVAVHSEPQGVSGYRVLAASNDTEHPEFYGANDTPTADGPSVAARFRAVGVNIPPAWEAALVLPKSMAADLYSERFESIAALGEKLFHDPALSSSASGNPGMACVSCHRPELAFTDGRALALGADGEPLALNSPTVVNRLFSRRQFFDGRSPDLLAQTVDPIVNPQEMNGDLDVILSELNSEDCSLRDEFVSAFALAGNIEVEHLQRALAAYMATLTQGGETLARARPKRRTEPTSPWPHRPGQPPVQRQGDVQQLP